MADVFLSYAREDQQKAKQFADALATEGWSVWWDDRIPTAAYWERVLLPELDRARCVVVLWSCHSGKSRWVKREAAAGADRTVLVPALIEGTRRPRSTRAIQIANLTSWTGDPMAEEFKEFLEAVRVTMLPRCEIRFQSLLRPERESVEMTIQTLIRVANRILGEEGAGRFRPPAGDAERNRLERLIASIQISIQWHPTMVQAFAAAMDQEGLQERLVRIENRIGRLWLDLLHYSGPWQFRTPPIRVHENLLIFASLLLYHRAYHGAGGSERQVEVEHPLTTDVLSVPAWQFMLPILFEDADDLALAYVDRIDDERYLREEVVIYGPRRLSEAAYEKSWTHSLFTEPRWLEEWFIPQYELLLALDHPSGMVSYGGQVHIRKITDAEGVDL